MLKPQTNSVFLAAFLSWSTQFVVLTLHLHGAQTPPGTGRRGSNLKKGEQGDRRVEEVQDNYRREKNNNIGVCSHHWPASHSPPSAAHSLGWQPALCRSCWPPSPPGWRGRGEKQRETPSSVKARWCYSGWIFSVSSKNLKWYCIYLVLECKHFHYTSTSRHFRGKHCTFSTTFIWQVYLYVTFHTKVTMM